MKLADGTIIKKLVPFGEQFMTTKDIIVHQRQVAFMPDPVFEAEVVKAHVEIGAPSACVVIAKRGPRGGWAFCKFYAGGVSYSWLRKQQQRGYFLHLGRIVSN